MLTYARLHRRTKQCLPKKWNHIVIQYLSIAWYECTTATMQMGIRQLPLIKVRLCLHQ
jgi:hypothetical protein